MLTSENSWIGWEGHGSYGLPLVFAPGYVINKYNYINVMLDFA